MICVARKRRYLGDLGLSMSPPAQPSTPHQKTIHVPVVDSPGASGGASGVATGEPVTTKQTYLLSGLEHYTEYLFFISACHEPHDEYGNPLPCVSETEHLLLCRRVCWGESTRRQLPTLSATKGVTSRGEK